MRPGSLASFPPRIWTVGIRTRGEAPSVECRTCGPVRDRGSERSSVRRMVISHLAAHARRDLTPAHLRMCQCGRCGCPWHRRHRGCAGPIRLALTYEASARAWRLTDLCRQCCQATARTTTVPHPPVCAAEHSPLADPIAASTTPLDEELLAWETS